MYRVSASLLGLTLAGALALPSSAADLGSASSSAGYKDAYAPAPVWTGFYAGVNGGYGWSASDSSIYVIADFVPGIPVTSPTKSFDKTGGFGGGQFGYNLQRDHLVFGIETDIQGGDISGSGSAILKHSNVSASLYRDAGLDWFGTVRGRAGYAFDRALIYFSGGFAYGGTHGVVGMTLENGAAVQEQSLDVSAIHVGYVLGGGIEYAFTPAWSLKGEYQFIDFGGDNERFAAKGVPAAGFVTNEQNFNTVRVGLNYHLLPGFEPLK